MTPVVHDRRDVLAGGERARRLRDPDAVSVLGHMATSLSGARTTGHVVSAIVEDCLPRLGADGGALALVDDRARTTAVVAVAGSAKGAYTSGSPLPLDGSSALSKALHDGATGGVVTGPAGPDGAAGAMVRAVPLRAAGRALGSVELWFDVAPGPGTCALLGAAAALWALALERAQSHDSERAARRSLHHSATRLRFVAEATRVLSESVTLDATLDALARLPVPRLADASVIHLLRSGRPHLAASAAVSGGAGAWLPDPGSEAEPAGLATVLRNGRCLVRDAGEPDGPSHVAGAQPAALSGPGLGTIAVAPLSAGGRVLGTITLGLGAERSRDVLDIALVEELGARGGAAIERAQVHEEQARAIDHLQAGLLPRSLPRVPGLEFEAVLVPASSASALGGDFYDAVPAGDGRVWLVIGDVQGKGVAAATLTGVVRHAVRAAVVGARHPSDVLAHVNEVLLTQVEPAGDQSNQLCTLCVMLADPRAGTVRLANAGHPPPLLLTSAGAITRLGSSGMIAGAFPDVSWVDGTAWLDPGDAVVCVTDGVTERRRGTHFLEDELDNLLRCCKGCAADQLVDRLRAAALEFSPSAPSDDLAVLALRLPPARGPEVAARA